MSNEHRIIGGTAGYNKMTETSESSNNKKRLFMFKPDAKVSAVFISKNTRFKGCILPAFDTSMDRTDTAYKEGYSPYRVPNMTDPETGCPYFSDWFVVLGGYNYYGNGKMNFFSPKSIGLPDPIQDIRKYCWDKHNAGDTTYDYLINRPERFGDPYALPKVARLTLLNVVCPATYDKDPIQGDANRVLILKSAATDRLFKDLNEPAPRGLANDNPQDEWADIFCLGDITNPMAAMKFSIAQDKLDNNMDYTCLSFGKVMLSGTSRKLICERTVISQEFLTGRFDLTDLENVVSIPTYQEIVDMLVQDELIPFELIQTVCGEKATVRREITSASDDYDSEDEYTPSRVTTANTVSAPEPPAPAPTIPAPAAPRAKEEEFYVTINGAVSKKTISEINDIQDPDLPVHNGSAWVSAATFPWYVVKAAAPVPPPPASMSVPAPAPASMVPTAFSVEKHNRTAEQEARFAELNIKLTNDEVISPAEIDELSRLAAMGPFKG